MRPQPARPWAQRAILAVFIAICTIVAAHQAQRMDIGLYDETAYLQRGVLIDTEGLPTADMAPIYSLWYRGLQLIVPDPVQRYLVNYGLTLALLPIVFVGLLQALGASQRAAVISGGLLLLSTLNVLNWPRVSVFALIVLLMGLLFQVRSNDRDRGWFVLLCTVAITVFIRPEFAMAWAGLVLLWSIDLFRRKRAGQRIRPLYGALSVLTITVLFATLGNPFAHGRTMVAFGQHYALNRAKATHSTQDPWTNWTTVVAEELGNAQSFTEAVRSAPDRVLWHVAENLRTLPSTVVRQLLPAGARPDQLAWVLIGLLLAAVAWLTVERWRPFWIQQRLTVLICCLLALPPLISMILIHPRAHYLVFVVVLFAMVVIGAAFAANGPVTRPWLRWTTLVAALLLVVNYTGGLFTSSARPVRATIGILRELPLRPGAVMLDADGGYDAYLPGGVVRCTAQDKQEGFDSFLSTQGIDVIVASPRLKQDHRYAKDPGWRTFLAGNYTEEHVRISVPGTEVEIFVARKALR